MAWLKNINIDPNYDETDLRALTRSWDQPNKQKMRQRWLRGNKPVIEWYSDLGHGVDIYGAIYAYINSNVGKPFDDVYSHFPNNSKWSRYADRYIGFYGYDSARRVFISSFNSTYRDYFIDSEGVIRATPQKLHHQNRDIKIYLPREQWHHEYRIDPDRFEAIKSMLPIDLVNELYNYINWGLYIPDSICNAVNTPELLSKIKQLRRFQRSYIFSVAEWLFESRLINVGSTIKAGTKEWYITRKKRAQQSKYGKKHRHDIDTEYYDAILFLRKRADHLSEYDKEYAVELMKEFGTKRY